MEISASLIERMNAEARNGPLAEHIVMSEGDRIVLRGRLTRIAVAEYTEAEIIALRTLTA